MAEPHEYLSTSCLHGVHGYCQSATGSDGTTTEWSKAPAACKFCGTPCICPCHAHELSPSPSPRRTAMSKPLTAGDLTDYRVEVTTIEGTQSRTVRAAYTTTEPGWLLLKDHEHRTVAQFKDHIVVMVERTGPAAPSDEDRIREAMAEAQDHPGRVVTR